MNSWPETTLDEVCSLITDGKHGDCVNENNSGYYFISAKDIRDGRINYENARQITEVNFSETHRRTDLQPGDLVVTNSGTIGRMAIAGEDERTSRTTFQKSVAILKPRSAKVSARFLYYYLTARTNAFIHAAAGAAQKNLLLRDIRRFRINRPSRSVQDRICAIVGAYDDLIENNRRRIALLEEAARLLYREWFVHLRFPGHEQVESTDGLPNGWERKQVSELADIYRGKSYKSSELVETDGLPFVNLKCFERLGGFRISGLKWFEGNFKDHHRTGAGDIVIAVTDMTRDALVVAQAGRIPKTIGDEAIFSMDLVKAVPAEEFDASWFYGMLRFSSFSREVREHATGATVLHLKPKHIESWFALVPPHNLRRLFADQFDALLEQIDNLELQNEKLAQARDLLLPRLMNGEITV